MRIFIFVSASSSSRRSADEIDDGSSSTFSSSNGKRYSDDAVTEYEEAMRGLKHRIGRTEVV